MTGKLVLQILLFLAQLGQALVNRQERRAFNARMEAIKSDPVAEWNRRAGRLQPAGVGQAGTAVPAAGGTGTAVRESDRGVVDSQGHADATDLLRAGGAVPELLIERCGPLHILPPSRATAGSAGFDLRSAETLCLMPGEQRMIPTGWKMAIPAGWCGQIWPRSGLAVRFEIDRRAGLIDEDYRGEVSLVLRNESPEPFAITANDRIGQLVILPYLKGEARIVEQLPPAERAGGFGSTGMH